MLELLNYNWVLSIREQCLSNNTKFQFRQCGTYLIKDGKDYILKVKDLCSQAKRLISILKYNIINCGE